MKKNLTKKQLEQKVRELELLTEEHRVTEAQLREKEATMRGLLHAAPLGIGMVNNFKERAIVWTNEHFARMLGYAADELSGRSALELYVDRTEFERVGRIKHPDMEIKGVGSLEARMRHKDGSIRDVFVSSAPIDPANPASEVVFTVLDITERKKVETALREGEERFRELAELLPGVIFEMDAAGVLTFVNRPAYRQFGFTRKEFEKGLTGFDFVVPEDRERARQNFMRIMAGERMGVNEYVALRKDGSLFPVLIDSAAITRDGRAVGVRGFMIDITDRKRLEEKLQQAQRMEAIGTLAGGIAHDFNNLLMGIQGNASIALLDTEAGHPATEKLTNIASYVKKATELTRQLLGLGRGGKYEIRTCDLSQLVNQVVDMFGRTKKELILHKKFEADLLPVKVDQGQIDQVLLNILVNAWQAMPGGGRIYVQTEKVHLDESNVNPYNVTAGEYAKLAITDTGTGMDEKTLDRVFDPFFTTKEKERGTGLGLASAYGIVKNHGGIITASSRKGEGTTFYIFLPLTDELPAAVESEPTGVSVSSETVLLIDDEEMIIEVGSRMLEKMGYVVLTADSGKRAVDILQKHGHGIDLVILDMVMPEMSGSETFDRLKALNPDVRVLLSSGYSVDGQAAEILQRGCDGFIQKPFDLEQLSSKVREVLNGH